MQLEERGLGLLVMLLGFFGLWVVYGISTGALPVGLPPPPPPPGVLIQPPIPSATTCLVPIMALTSVALIVAGFRRVIDP